MTNLSVGQSSIDRIFGRVRTCCCYIAITVFFFSTTGLSQLFKLPVLVSHYLEHQQRDQSIRMMDFLSMHYWGQDINDNDQDRDMQLPFKHVDQNMTVQLVIVPHQVFTIQKPNVVQTTDQPVFIATDHSDPALASLFRPPRA